MEILKIIMAIASIVFGVITLLQPQRVAELASLGIEGTRGKAEVRINWGGLFIGLGAGAIILQSPEAYQLFGIGYAGLAIMRVLEIAIDRSIVDRGYIVTLVFEALSAIVFLLP